MAAQSCQLELLLRWSHVPRMERPTLRLTIRGRVQGVGYRVWARDEARRLALDGWARNRRDGSVEILAIGSDEALGLFVSTCWRGPATAAVTLVERTVTEDDRSVGFDVRPTAP
jgi:acylphosphatase